MGSSEPEESCEASSIPKLSFLSLSSKLAESSPAGMLTPPPRTVTASIPFQWEEAPGKPKPCAADSKPKISARTLELPPRLLISEIKSANMPSPTTVLDWPYVLGGRPVSHSHRFSMIRSSTVEDLHCRRSVPAKEKGGGVHFGSMRWGSFGKINKEALNGSFRFSSSVVNAHHGGGDDSTTKVKITRVRRRRSVMSLADTSSNLLASIYESVKQVVPWRSRR
ncbi:uncharacterized protein At4g00950 [Juglans microcarpa x Juglans regia]|uniref:uncharacterized protein At4g00950 n=1 Tax=Juglans microcarpa x Juglans regia TaxID=2249226 RepID=UPI001B7E5983|nr:uncharacterized protein At4g00950 [Juglans microcarpa x Juglans regia]